MLNVLGTADLLDTETFLVFTIFNVTACKIWRAFLSSLFMLAEEEMSLPYVGLTGFYLNVSPPPQLTVNL